MHKAHLAIFITIAQISTASLPIVQVRTRMCLSVALLARYPALQIIHAHFTIAHITRTDIDNAIWDLQRLYQLFGILNQLLKPVERLLMIGFADHKLLDFAKLVNAEDAPS